MPAAPNISKQLGLKFAVPFLSVFILVGAGLAGFGSYCWLEARNVRLHWQTTDGRILASTSTHSGKSTKLDIRYRYTVDGQSYESDKVRVGSLLGDNSDAENLVSRYPAGHACTVYYNPVAPARSVLDAATNPVMIYLIAIGLAFFGLTAMALLNLLQGVFALRQLSRAAETIAATGAGDFRIGRTVLSLRPGGFGLSQRPKLLAGALGGAGLTAFVMLFVAVILLGPCSVDTKMTVIFGVIAAGLLAGLGLAAAWRSVAFDESSGTLTFATRRIFGQRRQSWAISQIKALVLVIRGVRVNQGQSQLLLKLRMADGSLVDLLSDGGADQTLLLAGTLLAQALGRPLVIQSEVTADNLETAMEAVEALGLKGTLTVDHAPEEMPVSVRKVVDKVVGTAEVLGVPPQAMDHHEPPLASVSGDHLAQGEPAATALASGSALSRVGGVLATGWMTLIGSLFPAALGLLGIYFLCVQPLVETVRATGWPTVPGRVTEVGNGASRSKGSTMVHPVVRYTYTVGGKPYERAGPFLMATGDFNEALGKRSLNAVLDRYHVGQEVPVRYNPANPARSALELTVASGVVVLTGFLSLFVVAGLFWGRSIWRMLREHTGFARLMSDGSPLNGRLGPLRVAEGPGRLDLVWRPWPLMPALWTWSLSTTLFGLALFLLAPFDPGVAMLAAWGLPLAGAIFVVWRCRRGRQQLSVATDSRSQIVQSFRQGWSGEPQTEEWPGEKVAVVFVDAELQSSKNQSYYVPRLMLMFTAGQTEPVLDKAAGVLAIATAAAALARSLGRPLWISAHLEKQDQIAIRHVLVAFDLMNSARVIGDLEDTSWDVRLGTDRKSEAN